MSEILGNGAAKNQPAFSADMWRKIIDATSDYETHLQNGLDSTPEAFASKYSDIPTEILTPELHRLLDEIYSLDSSSHESAEPRFLELDLLRTGGMGEIYRGVDQHCNRLVAIKKIRKEYQNDEHVRSRFRAEAELTASLEHPGIIPVYGQGIDSNGRDYYAMRLIAGKGSGMFQNRSTNSTNEHLPIRSNNPGNSGISFVDWSISSIRSPMRIAKTSHIEISNPRIY
jgi:hypothetical protein